MTPEVSSPVRNNGTHSSAPRTLADWARDPSMLEPPPALIPCVAYAGRVTLLSAREKLGKSTLAGQPIAAHLAGRDFLGKPLAPARALWYAIDESPADSYHRFVALGADRELVPLEVEPPSARLMREHVEQSGARVVVVDTLAELWNDRIVSDKDANEVAAFLSLFVTVARATDAALVLIHHTSKAGREYRGSIQLGAVVDLMLTLKRRGPAFDERSAEALADDGRRILEGVGRGGIHVREHLFFDGHRYDTGDRPLPLRALLFRELAREPRSATELTETVHRRKTDVLDELNAMKDAGLVVHFRREPWRLTERGMLEPSRFAH